MVPAATTIVLLLCMWDIYGTHNIYGIYLG
jgi:hypothetical protein